MPKGQTLSEYALTIGLVTIVGIAGLATLGQNVSGMLGGMVTREGLPALIDAGFQAGPGTTTLELSVPIPNSTKVAKINIPNYPFDRSAVATAVETSGSDAVSNKLAMTLKNFAQQLEDAGVLDKTQADILRAMSQEGFTLAQAQKTLQENVESIKSGGELQNPATDMGKYSAPGKNITDLLKEAREKHVLDNPIIKAIVEDAAKKIIESGTATSSFATNMISYTGSGVTLKQLQQFTGLKDVDTSVKNSFNKTTQNAAIICDTSPTGKISGLNCVKSQS